MVLRAALSKGRVGPHNWARLERGMEGCNSGTIQAHVEPQSCCFVEVEFCGLVAILTPDVQS